MSSLKREQLDAARSFVESTLDALRTERGVHAETAVAGTARMAGTFLFRSFAFPLGEVEPGTAVFSDEANEQGPRLVQILGSALVNLGVPIDSARLRTSPASGAKPLLGFLETQRKLEPRFDAIRDRLGLSSREAADAAAVATAALIQQCAGVLDPHAAFGIAVAGFVEGSKTAPDPVKP